MSVRLIDCAVFGAPGTETWTSRLLAARAQEGVQWWPLWSGGEGDEPAGVVSDPLAAVTGLRRRLPRFDALVLLVSRPQLVWSRQLLAALSQGPPLGRPVLAMVRGLGALAIDDLLRLGLVDFIDDSSGAAEQRARLLRAVVVGHTGLAQSSGRRGVARSSPPATMAEPALAYPSDAPASRWSVEAVCATVPHCPTLMRRGCPMSVSVERAVMTDHPYRDAKERVLARFEQAYVRAMLGVHHGNITRAARGANKPRRAFWGLVRKHGIDASAYYRRPRAVLGHAGCPTADGSS